jgi:thiamine pyrophosphokinase
MKLPIEFQNFLDWTLVGPMGPNIPPGLNSYPLLAIDGGAHFCQNIDLWIGDGDSFPEVVKGTHIFQFPKRKNRSDLSLALELFDQCGPVHLHCWGLLGGRRDHEMINLGEMLSFLQRSQKKKASFYNAKGQITIAAVSEGDWEFNYHGIFSIAAVQKANVLLTGNCEYPLPTSVLFSPLSSFGLSNVGHGDFRLKVDSPVLIFFSGENPCD